MGILASRQQETDVVGFTANDGGSQPKGLGKAFNSISGMFMNVLNLANNKRVGPTVPETIDNPLLVAPSGGALTIGGNQFVSSETVFGAPLSAADTIIGKSVTSVEIQMNKLGALEIQKPAPKWAGTAVVDGVFQDISLDDYKGKYLVFFFYPLDFTFVCPTEIIAFSDRIDEFRAIDCEVVACSTDSHFCHFAWTNQPRKQGGLGPMNIPLLADKTGEISKAYGVFKEDAGIAFRGLFIIDGKQNLRQITINDLPVGRSVEETLRLVQAFQFTDKHGEVCPAGWKPGQKTIKPSVDASKEYFEAA